MRIPIAIVGHATTRAELQAFADATTLIDVAMLRNRSFPPLYRSGIVYRAEMRGGAFPGVERFQTVDSSHDVGADDCDGLASRRAAELIVSGVRARAWVVRSPGVGWHVVTLWWDERGRMHLEDPSARLGMLGGAMYYDDEDDDAPELASVRIEGDRATMVLVGAIVPGCGAIAARAVATDDEDDDDDDAEPSSERATSRRKRRARAAARAFGRLAREASRVATTPARLTSEARREAERIASRADHASRDAREASRGARATTDEVGRVLR